MKAKGIKRSPLFYVGDKYKLIPEIKNFFPTRIKRFVEPFVGGGSVFLNVEANEYALNDIDSKVIELHKFLCEKSHETHTFYSDIFSLIGSYHLSCSCIEDVIPQMLKEQFAKTYYAAYNKDNFNRLKADYNSCGCKNVMMLYVLLVYGFNRMLRFNKQGLYNLPVGNVDFNSNTVDALDNYFSTVRDRSIKWSCSDFREFFDDIRLDADDFVYLDPPYLITFSEYNKLWNEENERELLAILDALDTKHIRFAVSNVTHYKGRKNEIFMKWSEQYSVHPIKSNYISYHDNTVKRFNEVLVTNF